MTRPRRRSIRIEVQGAAVQAWHVARQSHIEPDHMIAPGVFLVAGDTANGEATFSVIDHGGDIDAPHRVITRALERLARATAGEHGVGMDGLTHECDQLRAEVIYG